jgi:GNAT superfamily N-acetyltransferase
MVVRPPVRKATKADYDAIVTALPAFWGERAGDPIVRELHQALFLHEFGDTAYVVDDGSGGVAAYLFGFVASANGTAYVHVVAVRKGHRGLGLATLLYEEFIRDAKSRGARSLKATTTPGNTPSLAFHERLGMTAREIPDYAGPGRSRVVLSRELSES